MNTQLIVDKRPLVTLADDALEQMLAVNTKGVLITIRETIPHLANSGGSVVNISSTLAQANMPGAAAYSGSKAAVERITSLRISPKRWCFWRATMRRGSPGRCCRAAAA